MFVLSSSLTGYIVYKEGARETAAAVDYVADELPYVVEIDAERVVCRRIIGGRCLSAAVVAHESS